MNTILSFRFALHRVARGLALAGVVGACAVAGTSTASAQATAGKVFGKAPAGYSITVHSDATGIGRTVKADAEGRYSAAQLQPGIYTVTLKQDDQPVAKHLNVPVTVGRGIEVDFKCGEIKCNQAVATK
ncbi:carboxypeptidase-like regulatory domain-containing protein [Rhodanobacter caeni]|uniref:Oar protein n=1 Tax=Rhodanobacter caeni TaxID=657654 RepID=A0ABP3EIV8_9GAMM